MHVRSTAFVVLIGLYSGVVAPQLPLAPTFALADDDHPDAELVSLGTTKIGAYDVEVLQEGEVEAGKEATFQLRIKGEPEPTAVRVWVGIETGRGSAKGKAHKHGEKMEVHCEVPDPMPADAQCWVELEINGEKSSGGFKLKQD